MSFADTAAPTPVRLTAQVRPYQVRIHTKGLRNWMSGLIQNQIVVSPTGAGKTFMGLKLAAAFVKEVATALYGVRPEEVGVFWMACRSTLLEQADRDNRAFAPEGEEFLCPNVHYVSSFANAVDPGPYKVRLLVCDEAHHSSTSSELSIMATLKPQNMLGLSATPMRTDRAQLQFQTALQDAGYRTLIADGYLSQFRFHALDAWSVESSVDAFLAEPERFGRSLFFYRTREECERAAARLGAGGFPTDVVHGGSDREAVLPRFAGDGDRQTLVSMAILAEGYDNSSIRSVFVRDCQSPVLSVQMAGRALRLHNGMVKNIVQSVQHQYPFTREADAAEQFVMRSRQWVNVSPSERVKEMLADTAARILRCPPTKLPDWNKVRGSMTAAIQSAADAAAASVTRLL